MSPEMERIRQTLSQTVAVAVTGRVVKAAGVIVEAALPRVALGTQCEIRVDGAAPLLAEVVGVAGANVLLLPFGDLRGVHQGCIVVPRSSTAEVLVGDALLGRIVDSLLRPIDGGSIPPLSKRVKLDASPPVAMSRRRISEPFTTGVRAIDCCLTLGEGQRVAVLAGPGVGKSVLLGMLARQAQADVVVVGLIGERGREVREFVERDLGAGLARSVVVVATGDEPPLLRVRAARAATAVAEHFRASGKRVLLLIDSLSRVAMAQREIGLAAGEPPTAKGYPPSVFAALPRLVERAGNDAGSGSITALYTVLAEGDDLTDPVADAVKATLDGHLVLTRPLAEAGQFPAIDVLLSVSRVMSDIVATAHLQTTRLLRELLAAHRQASDLIDVGAYVAGANPKVDRALRVLPAVKRFLRQDPSERQPTIAEGLAMLRIAMEMKEGER